MSWPSCNTVVPIILKEENKDLTKAPLYQSSYQEMYQEIVLIPMIVSSSSWYYAVTIEVCPRIKQVQIERHTSILLLQCTVAKFHME